MDAHQLTELYPGNVPEWVGALVTIVLTAVLAWWKGSRNGSRDAARRLGAEDDRA